MFSSKRQTQFFSFLIVGSVNTLITYSIYLLLSMKLSYKLSFSIAYFSGIALAYWLNSVITFRTTLSWPGLISYPLIYLLQYFFSTTIFSVLIEIWGVSKNLAPLAVTIIMLPISFLMNKLILESLQSQEQNKPVNKAI